MRFKPVKIEDKYTPGTLKRESSSAKRQKGSIVKSNSGQHEAGAQNEEEAEYVFKSNDQNRLNPKEPTFFDSRKIEPHSRIGAGFAQLLSNFQLLENQFIFHQQYFSIFEGLVTINSLIAII